MADRCVLLPGVTVEDCAVLGSGAVSHLNAAASTTNYYDDDYYYSSTTTTSNMTI